MSESNGLPKGWVVTTLKSVGEWYGGGTPSKFNSTFWANGDIAWVSPKDMKSFRITDSEDHISSAAIEQTSIRIFPPGTVLVVIRSGILSRTLPVAVADIRATMNQDLKGVRPFDGIDPSYVAYFLHSDERTLLNTCSKHGTTVPSIDTIALHSYLCRLAPSNEQRRIVAKIEELFCDLDAGVAALERAKANLRRYRASVLKAAVEGKLTAKWRAKHPKIEPASKLLERILLERRRKWEADELAKFTAAGKEPPKNWTEKYVQPSSPATTDLPELPKGWCWASVDQTAECLDHLRIPINKEERAGRIGKIPYYGANGLVGWIDDFLFDEPLILIVEDETFVGREKPFSYKITGKSWVNNHAHILRSTSAVELDFLNCAMMHYPFVPLTTGTTGRRKLTKNKLMSAPFALPPLVEQQQIVAEVEERLSIINATERQIESSLLRATRLRKSILKQAFEGKLVPQDPKDETASKLLERIHKNAGDGKPTSPKRKRTKQEAS